jgi:hypothetical protein
MEKPHPKLVALSELLVGRWRVSGPDIEGLAEYSERDDGRLLVALVDFTVSDSGMTVLQHIRHDPGTDTLRARYMDNMGGEAIYTWGLEHPAICVSLGDADSDTYFQATLNADNSEYVGTWHYPDDSSAGSAETIVYTRKVSAL